MSAVVLLLCSCGTDGTSVMPPRLADHWLGLIAPSEGQLRALEPHTVGVVVVPAGWDRLEPQQGKFDKGETDALVDKIGDATSRGLRVVLDPGLQYPPSWVFDLSGDTRFVNQYGDAWHGRLSEDVPNAVFDQAVRSAQSAYLTALGRAIGGRVAGVRVGGLLSGELRYPPPDYRGRRNSVWAYDRAAQARAPVPGWQPGTKAGARASIQYYLDSLTGYERWLVDTTRAAFPLVELQVLFPGWGLRPGMIDAAVSTDVVGDTNAERNGILAGGGDWAAQVGALAPFARDGVRVSVYCTWIDAPTQGAGPTGEPPIAYLARLARPLGLALAGENTGGGGTAALSLSFERVRRFGLTGFAYMAGSRIADGSAGLDLRAFIEAAERR